MTILDELAPFAHMAEWDNSGLQVGDLTQKVHTILFALDPTMDALTDAIRKKAQVLLTHHPLIFRSLSSIDCQAYPGNVIFQAIQNNISIISAHTNLDMARGGVNDMLAQLLELQHTDILDRAEPFGTQEVGLGRIGSLPRPVKLSSMVGKIKDILGASSVRVMGDERLEITRVAIVGGSGGSLIDRAYEKGADVLITGDIGHHDALKAAVLGLALIDAGHFFTERVALKSFADHFKETVSTRDWNVNIAVYEDEEAPMPFE
jgi:dinuclear metal center YbgI/SA1388 family protein